MSDYSIHTNVDPVDVTIEKGKGDAEIPLKSTLLEDILLVAAAGSASVGGLTDERAIDAAQAIIDRAPEHIRDDFQKCCAYQIYRILLMNATTNNDTGQMYAAQSALMQFLND